MRNLLQTSGRLNLLLFIIGMVVLLYSNRIYTGQFKWLRLIAYLALLLQLLRTYYLLVVKPRQKGWKGKLGTLLMALMGCFLLLETAFIFVRASHGSCPDCISHQNWLHAHWQDVNAEGYRTGEFEEANGKKAVLVIGDSFTAGSGLPGRRARFSDRLAVRLGDQWHVHNIAVPGSGTRSEAERLEELDLDAEALVLGYCLNDIHEAARRHGHTYGWVPPASRYPGFLRPLFHYSHFFNYLYARVGYFSEQPDYVAYLEACYADLKVLDDHGHELQRILTWARRKQMPVLAVIFPLMQAPAASRPLTRKALDLFDRRGVPAIDVVQYLDSLPAPALIVDPLDPHPSARVHAIVADQVRNYLKLMGVIKD